MKLFLTSEGLNKETTRDFIKLLGKDPKETEICFIPTAAYPEINKDFLEQDKKNLRKIGCKVTDLDLKRENKKSLAQKLKNFDVILVGGGNTFYLLKYIRKSGFDKIIIPLLKQGKVSFSQQRKTKQEVIYFGISAGSIVAGPEIGISNWDPEWDKNVVNLKNLTGLNLIPFAISPHFAVKNKKILEEKSKTVDYPLVAINDKQAVVVNGEKVEIIGKGKKVIFNKDKFTDAL